jgi:hypothetical protein
MFGQGFGCACPAQGRCKLIPANRVFDFTKITLDSNPIRNKNPLHIRVVGVHLKGALLF